jgi:hypothetical protein
MSRRWLVVIDDPESEFSSPEELEHILYHSLDGILSKCSIARVQRGGLLADKVMAELPPVRHERMGRGR